MKNVEEKKLQQTSLKKYFAAFGLFLLFMMFSILYFFYCVQVNVAAAEEDTMQEHVKRQSHYFQELMLQYEYSDEIRDHILFEDIYDGEGCFLIVGADGTVVSDDGMGKSYGIGTGDHFFEYYGAMDFKEGSSIGQVQADFDSHTGNRVKLKADNISEYLVYEPLEWNGWMLCYVVPVSKVEEGFGFIRYYELILTMVLLAGLGVFLFYIWDVNQKEKRALMKYARTDALTGALNKSSTEEEIQQWLADKRARGRQVLMMLDIDNFKTINDVYGHAAGDEALRQVGQLLQQVFREEDIIGRIGGDEFTILMKNIMEEDTVLNRAENLCSRFREITIKELKGRRLSCSIGMAWGPEHGTTYQELYLCADNALYTSKKNGRNGYTMYQKEEE